jgi:hypothetical protein
MVSIFTLFYFHLIAIPKFEFVLDHALYLSSTELKFKEKEILITVKVFSDDLRDAIKNHDPASYQSGELAHFVDANSKLIEDYFRLYLTLKNEKDNTLTLHYMGSSIEGDAHFIQLSAPLKEQEIALSVTASFFIELFPTQMNIVVVKQGDQSTYLKFTYPTAPQQVVILQN